MRRMSKAISNKSVEERKRYFRMVRDIPYYIALGDEQDYCCATKPLMLDRLLSTLELKSRHILATFRWQKIGLPSEIVAIPHDDLDTHEFLTVFIPETRAWVRVDPNWDSRIKNPNLPVSEWDGLHDTSVAVPIEKVYSPEESERLIAEEDSADAKVRQEYLNRNMQFFTAVNRWIDSQRVKSL